MSRIKLPAALVVTMSALGMSTLAAARDVRTELQLDWSAPEGCPDRNAARAAIADALEKSQTERAKAMVVRVKIAEGEPGHWVGEIWMYDAGSSGERSIEGSSCKQVANAVTLVVALALDASRGEEPAKVIQPPKPPPPSAAPQFALQIGVVGDVGSLPQPDPGLALVLGLQYQRLLLELQGTAWLPRSSLKAGAIGGRFQLYTGAARGCVDVLSSESGRPGFGPCLTAELGGLIGDGTGLSHPEHENILWVTGLAGAFLRFPVAPPVFGTLHVDVGAPFRRPAWQIAELGPVFQPERVVWRVFLGAGWFFR